MQWRSAPAERRPKRREGRVALVAIATLAALVPLPSRAIERFYSASVYPILQPVITAVSNRVPFALLDILILSVVVAWSALAVRQFARARGRLAAIGAIVLRTIVWSSALYLLFLLGWGLNYRRVPLERRLAFQASEVTPAAARALGVRAVDEVNALYQTAHASGWPDPHTIDPALAVSFAGVTGALQGRDVVVARPKATALDWYFRRAAVQGMTDPFFLEALVASDLLPFERPLVVAHEWSHLAGLADEGEANFLGWLACVRASAPSQFSGWLFLLEQVAAGLPRRDGADLIARLGPGPRGDLEAIANRIARNASPRISAIGWRAYDRYLKANRVEEGVASYQGVVRLVLGVRLGPDGTPMRLGS